MKWTIPAKTFLLGEYVAVAGGPALIATTTPCFTLAETDEPGLHGIHPQSPAGRWWADHGINQLGLQWHDPYQGRGGMGASSAQFLAVYLAGIHLKNQSFNQQVLLGDYLQYAWQGQGVPPSGYDVLAQSMHGCVYINREQALCQPQAWPFPDLAFILVHTGKKLATHEHLQSMTPPASINSLATIVDAAKRAMHVADSQQFVTAVNAYQQALIHLNLMASHSQEYVELLLKQQNHLLAAKGCGAMGADVLLLLLPKDKLSLASNKLAANSWHILATSDYLYGEQ